MKAKILTVLLLGSALCSHPLISAEVVGNALSIGTQNTVGWDAGAIGNYNYSGSSGGGFLQVGEDNFSSDSWQSLIVGYGNNDSGLVNSALIGRYNTAGGSNNLVVGENNALSTGYDSTHASLLGLGLLHENYSSIYTTTIVGKYNKTIADPLFVVANGTSAASEHRKNALEITQDGKMSLYGVSPTIPTIVLDPNISQITVGGQPLVVPNSSGNVGIGTATPQSKLHVVGTATFDGPLNVSDAEGSAVVGSNNTTLGGASYIFGGYNTTEFDGAGNDSGMTVLGYGNNVKGGANVTVGSNNVNRAEEGVVFGMRNTIPASGAGMIFGSNITNEGAGLMLGIGDSAKMTILPNGKFGIGTTTPFAKLTVSESASDDNNSMGMHVYSQRSSGTGSTFGGYFDVAQTWGGADSAIGVVGIVSSFVTDFGQATGVYGEALSGTGVMAYGNIGIQATGTNMGITSSNNSATGVALSTSQGNSSGFNIFAQGGKSYFSGSVGIGTSNPTAKMHVSGNAAIGTGVVGGTSSQVVLGKYNDTRTADNGTNHTQGVLIVGSGTGTATNARKNAMRVLDDGTVLVKASGDISMGEFTHGPTP